jgi:hypothetical protein
MNGKGFTTPFTLSLSKVNGFVWATVCCIEILRGQAGMPHSQACADVVFARYGGHPVLVAEY